MHGAHVQDAGDSVLTARTHGGDTGLHVARHRVERIECDDVADSRTDIADLTDQADRADHAGQGDGGHCEQDGADAAEFAFTWFVLMCAHHRLSITGREALPRRYAVSFVMVQNW